MTNLALPDCRLPFFDCHQELTMKITILGTTGGPADSGEPHVPFESYLYDCWASVIHQDTMRLVEYAEELNWTLDMRERGHASMDIESFEQQFYDGHEPDDDRRSFLRRIEDAIDEARAFGLGTGGLDDGALQFHTYYNLPLVPDDRLDRLAGLAMKRHAEAVLSANHRQIWEGREPVDVPDSFLKQVRESWPNRQWARDRYTLLKPSEFRDVRVDLAIKVSPDGTSEHEIFRRPPEDLLRAARLPTDRLAQPASPGTQGVGQLTPEERLDRAATRPTPPPGFSL